MMKLQADLIYGGLLGLCTADALGVPFEGLSRQWMKRHPVTEMEGCRYDGLPPGSWSDDSSATFCLADSLAHMTGAFPDKQDLMERLCRWMQEGDYTPRGAAFGMGRTTIHSLERYLSGLPLSRCGGKEETDNGNGSLMRILPLAFYFISGLGPRLSPLGAPKDNEPAFSLIHEISALTHAHPRSMMACGIYLSVALLLMEASLEKGAEKSSASLLSTVCQGISGAQNYYSQAPDFQGELLSFSRIFRPRSLSSLPQEQIASGGYVIDTLESALWCLLNTDSYQACVLKAISLGGDTDTTAAVAGGLCGLWYGPQAIPSRWLEKLARKEWIQELCRRLAIRLGFL